MKTVSVETHIETATAHISLTSDGIVRIVIKPTEVETLENAMENVEAVHQINHEVKRPLFVNTLALKHHDPKIVRFYSSENAGGAIEALAILVESPLLKFMVNFMMSMNRFPVPRKLFTNENEALEWLMQYRQV